MPLNSEQPTVFRATATHSEMGGGEMVGKILLHPNALLFESETANCGIPLDRLMIEAGPSGQIILTDAEQREWEIRTPDAQLLSHYSIQQRNRLRIQARAIQAVYEGRRNMKLAVAFVICFLLAAALLWGLSGWAVNLLVDMVPVSAEINLGRSAFTEIKAEVKVLDSPQLTAEIESVAEPLLRNMPGRKYKFEFLLIESAIPNAVALPGGKILVCTGLLKAVDKPEELAGVLAHEMAHVTRRHGLRQMITTMGRYYLLKLFISDKQGFVSMISNGSQLLVRQSFSRRFENEADETGFASLVKANIDPRGLSSFLSKTANDPLVRRFEESSLQILNSHPPTSERIQRLEKLWQQTPHKSGFLDLPKLQQ